MILGFRAFLPIVGLALGFYAGCTGSSSETPVDNACEGIIEACHTKDDGSVENINDCHTVGHDGVEADCQAQYQDCVALCDAAPEVAGHDDGQTDDGHADTGHADTGHDDGATSGTSHADDGSTTMDVPGTTGGTDGGSSDGGASTSGDDASNANCDDLGSGCHDVPGEIPQMCHDVGHDGDEMACAEIWLQCVEACGL